MALSVNRVTSANIYYDGNSLLGKAESFTLQELPFVMSEHKALGALGTTQYFADTREHRFNGGSSLGLFYHSNTDEFTSRRL